MQLIINNTKQKIAYKDQIFIPYQTLSISNNGDYDTEICQAWFIAIRKGDAIEKYFDYYEISELEFYLVKNHLLLNFKGTDQYFVFLELDEDILKSIIKNNSVNFITLEKNKIDYYFTSDELKGIS